ncbi:MAG: hypothetical protein O3B24_10785 [Verrucomicrobia bacterium]|nr:hypothetical protein [Verrucomicrobiota bacterium]
MTRIASRIRSSQLAAAVAALVLFTCNTHAESYRTVDGRDCAILDMPFITSGSLSAVYLFAADTSADGWEELSASEVSAVRRLAYWETDSGADFDLQFLGDSTLLNISGPDDEFYPLTMARLRLRWTQRFEADYGFEMDVSPGLYTTFESFDAADFAVPLGFRWIKPITPDFSVFAGANVYPSFDHAIDPRIGLRLAHRDNVVVDFGYPESSISLSPGPRFRLTGGARVALWPEYNMGDDPRERVRYEEIRVFGALDIGITGNTILTLHGGTTAQRKISFESASGSVDIDDAMFAGVGLSSMF